MINCSEVQAALSARLDGEHTGVPDDVVDAHLSGCPHCQQFLDQAASFNRLMNFSGAGADSELDAPDLSQLILAEVEPVRRRQALRFALLASTLRVLLAIFGLVYVGWAVALLTNVAALPTSGLPTGTLISTEDPLLASLLFDAAAFRLALAFGLFFAAWRPQQSAGLFPVFGALFTFTIGFGVRDFILGYASAGDLWSLGLMALTAALVLASWLNTLQLGSVDRMMRSVTSAPQREL